MINNEYGLKQPGSSQMLDPVEHAVVEATWGEVFTNDNRELLKSLGAVPMTRLMGKPDGSRHQ